MSKRDAEMYEEEAASMEPKRPKQSSIAVADATESVQVKVLIPAAAVGAFIGKGGEALKQLKQTSGCVIKMSSTKDIYPGTNERIGLIRGAASQVLNILRAIGDTVADKVPPGSFNMDQYDQNNTDRSKTIKLIVPPTSAASVIGKSGVMIKEIREKTGANIQIFPKAGSPEAERTNERIISVVGADPIELETAVAMVLAQIAADPHHAQNSDISGAAGGALAGTTQAGSVFESGYGAEPAAYGAGAYVSPFGSLSRGGAIDAGFAAVGVGAATGYDQSYMAMQRSGMASDSVKYTGSYTPAMMYGGGDRYNGAEDQGAAMRPHIKFQNKETVDNQEVLSFLDSLQATLRSSGFADNAVSEIMSSMQTLAKYNIMGLGLGLGVAAMAGIRPGSIGQDSGSQAAAAKKETAVSAYSNQAVTGYAGYGSAGGGYGAATAMAGGAAAGGGATHEDYSDIALYVKALENAASYAKHESSNFAATVIKEKPNDDPRILELEIPNSIVGAVLGPRAATLNEIKRYSGANCVVEKQVPGGTATTRTVTLTGDADNVRAGRLMVERAINEEQHRRLTGGPLAAPGGVPSAATATPAATTPNWSYSAMGYY